MAYWNYLMARNVLTGDNQHDALEFLYNHNTTYLLIDSTDLSKYDSYSGIGSDENYDRSSLIKAFVLDENQTQQIQDKTIFVYSGGLALDEDLIINENGKEILLPQGVAVVGAMFLPINNINPNEILKAEQPELVVFYQEKVYRIKMRYLYGGGEFVDFGSGIESCIYVFPKLIPHTEGTSSNPIGVALFISPRLMRGLFTQLYILNDPFNNFPNFKLVHSEPDLMIDSLNNQGMDLPEFVAYSEFYGPIKIWEIEYTGNEQIKEEYLETDTSKYLSWQL